MGPTVSNQNKRARVNALVPPVESQIPPSSGQQNQNSVMFELQEAKLKIARLESILDESMPSLNAKSQYIREAEKKIEDISVEIDNLTTALSKLQHHSSRINTLEEKVRLLWDVARKNNFEIHTLEFKAQDGQKRLKVLASQVEKMAEIVSEQWIQIQQLEQAVQMAEMRTLKVKRQLRSSKCPFVKFIKNVFGNHLETLKGILHPYGSYSKADPNSYWDQALHHIQRTFASARQYHYELITTQLQKFVKHEIERNEFPAALANEEVVFLVASALIVFPILSVFMLLFSHLS
ncbi:uncharacterized protein LOC107783250 isoform X3 [Nicotiana tabacum]|uniref:Uncharacterized protein LOC107783250 isoform X3 n=2 Tax=Nicotiana TaxID=4085 RepID=A0A1S3Z664_TOBAC|nr:PREDICTED: uncharacterized protein LOC104210026 isoform X3 [Nicotiana sylvestris]XP_016459707.1 PREDICTED: uncharacterized protein LOC107783250 isoform X3 [Nicotiana tabacum]